MSPLNKYLLGIGLFLASSLSTRASNPEGFDYPSLQQSVLTIVLRYDSAIFMHGRPAEGGSSPYYGVAFKGSKVFSVRIEFPIDTITNHIKGPQLTEKIIDAWGLKDSLENLDINSIMALAQDSLDLDEKKFGCRVYDGGSCDILWIRNNSFRLKSVWNPDPHQDCHYTKERQIFLDAINLILKPFHFDGD